MNVSFVKWVSLSSLGAVALVGGLYLTIPGTLEGDVSSPVVAAKGDYSRTLYGVPKLKMDHYRLTEDEYFDLQIEGVLNVGRLDPAELPLWKTRVDKLIKADPSKNKKRIKNEYYKQLALHDMIYDVIELKKPEEAVDEVKKVADGTSDATKNPDGSLAQAEKSVAGTGTLKESTGSTVGDGTTTGGEVQGASGTAGTETTGATGTGATGTTGTNGTGVVDPNTGVAPTGTPEAVQPTTPAGTTGVAPAATTDGTSGVVNMGETKNVTTGTPSSN